VVLLLVLAALGLGYTIVDVSTKEAGRQVVEVDGIASMQRIFGGLPQEGDRLGSADAPVAVQVFNDLQCGNCRDEFLATIPPLVERYVRTGEAKLLLRHYSVARNPLELGFFGAEAAAEQGYGWQYAYLFFVNQDEAERFGVGERFMGSLAGSVGEIELPGWREVMEREEDAEGPIAERLEGYEELGRELGIRSGQALIVSGPAGARALQDGPSPAEAARAIEAVR
jgi:protein-disulfide isomerase